MKILFSPSEKKFDNSGLETLKNNLLFPLLYEKRVEVISEYDNLILNSTDKELHSFFELKSLDEIQKYKVDIFKSPVIKAVNRYDGVAYEYLKYEEMNSRSQEYIDENMIIFSNLFGAIKASDKIPLYKLKQGQKLPSFNVAKFHKENFSASLDKLLESEDILDLRAGFYDKFYKPNKNYFTIKFLKNGKVVSHFAKAYRGVLARELAQNSIQNIEEIMTLQIDKLSIKETIQTKNKSEIIMEIED